MSEHLSNLEVAYRDLWQMSQHNDSLPKKPAKFFAIGDMLVRLGSTEDPTKTYTVDVTLSKAKSFGEFTEGEPANKPQSTMPANRLSFSITEQDVTINGYNGEELIGSSKPNEQAAKASLFVLMVAKDI